MPDAAIAAATPLAAALALAEGHALTLGLADGVQALPLAGALLYHRAGKHTGVVLAYRVLGAACARAPAPPAADAIAIEGGHPGSGMEDAFEFFTRAVSAGRYRRSAFAEGCRVAGAPGVFRWRVAWGGGEADLDLRAGVLDPALFAPPAGEPAAARHARQRTAIAAILAAADDELFALRR